MAQNLKKEEEVKDEAYEATGEEKLVLDHLQDRIPVLKDGKKRVLEDIDFEKIMKDADREYMPRSLREKAEEGQTIMLIQDEVRGMRGSRIVPITGREGQEWRSDVSEPTLYVKVMTALSILVDQNPEAVFKAVLKRYKNTRALAKSIWQRSWSIANSKDMLKLFIFDLAKYGWAVGRTYPKLVQRKKDILTELNIDDPEKNKYETVTITEFDDIYRERLDPYRTYIDDKATLDDPFSLDDWYFEKDFSKDDFKREFGVYENAEKCTFGELTTEKKEEEPANEETKKRKDMITVGFYESKNKDLYAMYSPKDKVVIYYSPLPNDEGMLSLWDAPWTIRDPRTRYGIGLFEIIKNNKVLYDRLDNMDIDSLVMAIYSMLFYSGTNAAQGEGTIFISPGVAKQKLPGTTIDQVKIDYSGKGREGAQQQLERIDELTGLNKTLEGIAEGKQTLGEVLHAKDAALKRLSIPLGNIASAMEKDAYLTLSWASQLYTLPEVLEFESPEKLKDFMLENEREPDRLAVGNQTFTTEGDVGAVPAMENAMSEDVGEEMTGPITADFPRVLELPLEPEEPAGEGGAEENREGVLIESPENRFFVVGKDIPKKSIKWKGKVTIVPQSIIAPSQELERQRKAELYNVVQPVVQTIAVALSQGQFQMAVDVAKPVVQILEIQDEEPEDWLPDQVVEMLNDPAKIQQAQAEMAQMMNASKPLFVESGAEANPTAPSERKPELPGIAPKDTLGPSPAAKSLSEMTKIR